MVILAETCQHLLPQLLNVQPVTPHFSTAQHEGPFQLCSRHTTYPVLCLAALAHRAGAGDAAAENVPSTQTLLESQLQIAASLLSHTIHVSFMYDSGPRILGEKKKKEKKF